MKTTSFLQTLLGVALPLILHTPVLGQTNVIDHRVGIGSSYNEDYNHPLFASDGQQSTLWRTNPVNPLVPQHWIEFDLDAPMVLSRLVFVSEGDKEGIAMEPDVVRVQQWTGTDWQDIQVWPGNTDPSFDQSFGPVVSGKKVRLFFEGGGDSIPEGQFLIFNEIELYGVPHGMSMASSAPVENGFLIEPGDPVSLIFNSDITAIDLSRISLSTYPGGLPVGSVSASVNGSTLTVQHEALARNETYQLVVPADSLALASNGSVRNAYTFLTFTVAPPAPRLLSAARTVANLSATLVFVYDRPLALVNPNQVEVYDISGQSPVGPLGVSVNGNNLEVSHPGLTRDHLYRVVIGAGAVEGTSNGVDNPEYRGSLLGGEYVLYENDFKTGPGDVVVASDLGLVKATSRSWKWTNSGRLLASETLPDVSYMFCKQSDPGDFMCLPAIDFLDGETYSIKFAHQSLGDAYMVMLSNTTQALSGASTVASWPDLKAPSGFFSATWTSDVTGPRHLLFAQGNQATTNDLKVDRIQLVRNFPPALQVDYPPEGLVINEGDPFVFDVDALGISGELSRLVITDGEIDQSAVIYDGPAGRFNQAWDYDTPGRRTLTFTAYDDRGETTTITREVTINFSNGTLGSFLQWDFDGDDPEGVTLYPDGQYSNGTIRTNGGNCFSTPAVFLIAGETYTYQFEVPNLENGYFWAFEPTRLPGFPSEPDPVGSINLTGTQSGDIHSFTFTVPESGPYYLTMYTVDGSNKRNNFDNLRLIGNFNAAPLINIEQPLTSAISTVSGSAVTLVVNASDTDGSVAAVEFYSGSVLLGTVTNPDGDGNYTYNWTNVPTGTHSYTARVIDSAGGYTNSSPIQVRAAQDFLRINTYLGDTGFNEFVYEMEYQSDGTLLLAASMDPGLFPGNPPVLYLNGTTVGDKGVLAVLSEDGRTVKKVLVMGSEAVPDMAVDGGDRIYLALGSDGYAVLDATASTILAADTSPTGLEPTATYAHRIDAGPNGTFAVMMSSTSDFFDNPRDAYIKVFDNEFNHLGDLGRTGTYMADIAVDEINEQVVSVGYKNITTDNNPVDIPIMSARSYASGSLNVRTIQAYDWNANPGVAPQADTYSNGTQTFD